MTTFTTNFGFPKPGGSDAPDGPAQIGALADSVDTALTGIGTCKMITADGTVDSTTNVPYVNLAGPSSISFPKRQTASALKIDMHVTCFSTATATIVRFGVIINGINFNVSKYQFDTATKHEQVSGVAVVQGALAAGTYTVQAQWGRLSGAGTITRDANDYFSMAVTEVFQ